jgi:hypothetical protein
LDFIRINNEVLRSCFPSGHGNAARAEEKYKEAMAEFEPPANKPSPDEQLFARLKLQRVVFGAFAIVLVSLFALGLSAYRRMQGERDAASQAQIEATRDASDARTAEERRERELQDVITDLVETRRQLALAKCRIAMHEIRDGNPGRALPLLNEVRDLGPPPWLALVEHLSRERLVHFESRESPVAPVVAGAVNLDRTVVAVARHLPAGIVVEVHGAMDAQLHGKYPPVEIGNASDPVGRLMLARDGGAWYLSLPGRAYYGVADTTTAIPAGLVSGWEPIAPLGIDANDDLSLVYEAHGSRGLVARTRDEAGQWTTEVITLDLQSPAVEAVCLAGDKPVVATGTGIYFVGAGGRTGLLHSFEARADRYALHFGAGVVYAAVLAGRVLDIVAIKPGEELRVTSKRFEMPDEPVQDLRFLVDDTVVWVGPYGHVVTVNFSGVRDWTLGGYTLSFIERHTYGLVFANVKGELSLRTQPEFVTTGRPLHLVPPEFSARPTAHGFILAAPDGERFVVQGGRVRGAIRSQNVELAQQGPAWVDRGLILPDGTISTEPGVLRGAFADGSVLLFLAPKLKRVSAKGVDEFLLAGDRVPDSIVIAAETRVAALRIGDTVYIADMESDPQAVAGRRDVAPDLIALDAGARRLAIAYGPTVVIRDLRENVELTIRTAASPKQIALLFGGSVLATIETGELVFYEAEGGRELLRAGADITDIEAAGVGSLNILADGILRSLAFDAPG